MEGLRTLTKKDVMQNQTQVHRGRRGPVDAGLEGADGVNHAVGHHT